MRTSTGVSLAPGIGHDMTITLEERLPAGSNCVLSERETGRCEMRTDGVYYESVR
jgi:hypothetical protein